MQNISTDVWFSFVHVNFPNFTMDPYLPHRNLSHWRHPVTWTWVTMQLNLSAKCQVSPLQPASSSTPGTCTWYGWALTLTPLPLPLSRTAHIISSESYNSITPTSLKSFKLLGGEVSMGVEKRGKKKKKKKRERENHKSISEMPLTQMQILSKMCHDENWSRCKFPFIVLGLCIRQRHTRQ